MQAREVALFSEEDHINTLAPTADGKLWVVLHGSASVRRCLLSRGAVFLRLARTEHGGWGATSLGGLCGRVCGVLVPVCWPFPWC